MTLGALVVAILVFGLLFWLVKAFIPEPPQRIVHIILAVLLVFWLVSRFFPSLSGTRIGHVLDSAACHQLT